MPPRYTPGTQLWVKDSDNEIFWPAVVCTPEKDYESDMLAFMLTDDGRVPDTCVRFYHDTEQVFPIDSYNSNSIKRAVWNAAEDESSSNIYTAAEMTEHDRLCSQRGVARFVGLAKEQAEARRQTRAAAAVGRGEVASGAQTVTSATATTTYANAAASFTTSTNTHSAAANEKTGTGPATNNDNHSSADAANAAAIRAFVERNSNSGSSGIGGSSSSHLPSSYGNNNNTTSSSVAGLGLGDLGLDGRSGAGRVLAGREGVGGVATTTPANTSNVASRAPPPKPQPKQKPQSTRLLRHVTPGSPPPLQLSAEELRKARSYLAAMNPSDAVTLANAMGISMEEMATEGGSTRSAIARTAVAGWRYNEDYGDSEEEVDTSPLRGKAQRKGKGSTGKKPLHGEEGRRGREGRGSWEAMAALGGAAREEDTNGGGVDSSSGDFYSSNGEAPLSATAVNESEEVGSVQSGDSPTAVTTLLNALSAQSSISTAAHHQHGGDLYVTSTAGSSNDQSHAAILSSSSDRFSAATFHYAAVRPPPAASTVSATSLSTSPALHVAPPSAIAPTKAPPKKVILKTRVGQGTTTPPPSSVSPPPPTPPALPAMPKVSPVVPPTKTMPVPTPTRTAPVPSTITNASSSTSDPVTFLRSGDRRLSNGAAVPSSSNPIPNPKSSSNTATTPPTRTSSATLVASHPPQARRPKFKHADPWEDSTLHHLRYSIFDVSLPHSKDSLDPSWLFHNLLGAVTIEDASDATTVEFEGIDSELGYSYGGNNTFYDCTHHTNNMGRGGRRILLVALGPDDFSCEHGWMEPIPIQETVTMRMVVELAPASSDPDYDAGSRPQRTGYVPTNWRLPSSQQTAVKSFIPFDVTEAFHAAVKDQMLEIAASRGRGGVGTGGGTTSRPKLSVRLNVLVENQSYARGLQLWGGVLALIAAAPVSNDQICKWIITRPQQQLEALMPRSREGAVGGTDRSRPKVGGKKRGREEEEQANNDDEDEDDGVEFDDSLGMTVSVQCPISLQLISVPARGLRCTHQQCCELAFIVEICVQNKVWACPYCKGPMPFREISVDMALMDHIEGTPKSHRERDPMALYRNKRYEKCPSQGSLGTSASSGNLQRNNSSGSGPLRATTESTAHLGQRPSHRTLSSASTSATINVDGHVSFGLAPRSSTLGGAGTNRSNADIEIEEID